MHTIAVTVGLSIIEKIYNGTDYGKLMGTGKASHSKGLLSRCSIEAIENGQGSRELQLMEERCFESIQQLPDIPQEIGLGKDNRYSAEVSSLYAFLKNKQLEERLGYRIVLLATDSQDGIFAARLNKRAIAYKLFDCDKELISQWNSEADNRLHPVLSTILIRRASSLQVKDAGIFEDKGNESLERIIRELDADCNPGEEKILNITGGFKGVIPIVVGIAWYCGWKVVYLYEETEDYLIIERPPFIMVGPHEDKRDKRIVPAQRRPAC